MRLLRQAVIERINALLAEAQIEHEAQFEQSLAKWQEAFTQWQTDVRPALLVELQRVVKIVRSGKYPDTDLRNRYSRQDAIWGLIGAKPVLTPHTPNQKLTRLRTILTDATTDEFVTTAAIRELGFSPALFINA